MTGNQDIPVGSIMPLTLDDLDTFVEMHAEFINYGDGVRPYYQKELEDEDTVAFKYVIDDKIAGMVLFAKGLQLSGSHDDVKEKILSVIKDGSIYTGEALFVLPEYRHHRIVDLLLSAVRERLRDKKVVYSMRELWIHPDGTIPAAFTKGMLGSYIDIGTYPLYYKDFSKWGFICSLCGTNCRCSAQIMIDCIFSKGDEQLEIEN